MKYLAHILGITMLLGIGVAIYFRNEEEKEEERTVQRQKELVLWRHQSELVDASANQLHQVLHDHYNSSQRRRLSNNQYRTELDSVWSVNKEIQEAELDNAELDDNMLPEWEFLANGILKKYQFAWQYNQAPTPPNW